MRTRSTARRPKALRKLTFLAVMQWSIPYTRLGGQNPQDKIHPSKASEAANRRLGHHTKMFGAWIHAGGVRTTGDYHSRRGNDNFPHGFSCIYWLRKLKRSDYFFFFRNYQFLAQPSVYDRIDIIRNQYFPLIFRICGLCDSRKKQRYWIQHDR